jgi:hypothetical protein
LIQAFILYPYGFFIYQATYTITFTQPSFDFSKYPYDVQDVAIRFTVLNYDAKQLQIFPSGMYCSYNPDGSCSFAHHPLWNWLEEKKFCTIYYDPKPLSPTYPAYTVYTFELERYGNGITVRLIIPIGLLLVISALSFWMEPDKRVEMTITILLSVSALYIVILGNIPLVGYLTSTDKFVFIVSSTLSFIESTR